MFISTKMTTTDPKQSFITYIMPVVFGVISWNMPSGILIYWVTTNLWSIGQQYIVNKLVKKEVKKAEAGKKEVEQQKKLELMSADSTEIQQKKKKRKKKK